jgi:DNA primase
LSVSEEFITELKYKNNISDVISGYINLKQKGKNLVGICPFHAEKTASFFIYPSNESFYCFGCGKGGDVITFIRLIEKFDYVESLKFLCQRANMNFPEDELSNDAYKQKMTIYKINRESARFFHNNLCSLQGKSALEYLKKRNLSLKSIKHFGLGYSLEFKFSLVNFLSSKGYFQKDIIDSNVAYRNRSGQIIDRFSNRIMFPIIDVRGNVVGFGGRTISNNNPKYLNTSDTIVFKKSDNIFAMNFAKNSNLKNLILTEGYMDAISLHQMGFTNTIATLGTALAQGQVKLISRYTDEAILCFDSDAAGQRATLRAIDIFKQNGISSKVISIPNGKDPDEFIKYYKDESVVRFKELVKNATADIEYKLLNIKTKYDIKDAGDKIKYTSEILKILSNIENDIEKDIYCSKLSAELNISKDSIKSQLSKYLKKISKNKNKESILPHTLKYCAENKNQDLSLKRIKAEETILSYIINNCDIIANTFEKYPAFHNSSSADGAEKSHEQFTFSPNDSYTSSILPRVSEKLFSVDFSKKLYLALKKLILNNKDLNLNNILSEGFDIEDAGKITKIICDYKREHINRQVIEECILLIEHENQRIKIKNIQDINSLELKNYIITLKKTKQ